MTLLDLQGATTSLSGTDRRVPSRVKIALERHDVGGTVGEHTWSQASGTFPQSTIVSGGLLKDVTLKSRGLSADTANVVLLQLEGNPLNLNVRGLDFDLAVFETRTRLTFQTVDASWRSLITTIESAVRVEPAAAVPLGPFEAFQQLRDWLGLNDAETADLVGVGRTTPYTWRTRTPQAKRARRLFETHALVESLVERLGVAKTRDAVRRGGTASALAIVAKGRVAEAEDLFADVIFGVAEPGPSPFALRTEGAVVDPPPPVGGPKRSAGRRTVTATRRR